MKGREKRGDSKRPRAGEGLRAGLLYFRSSICNPHHLDIQFAIINSTPMKALSALYIILALIVGFAAGYMVFKGAPQSSISGNPALDRAINSLIKSKTSYAWNVQVRGVVTFWGSGELAGNIAVALPGGNSPDVRIVIDPDADFIDGSVTPVLPPRRLDQEDIAVGDKVDLTVYFDNGELLITNLIQKLPSNFELTPTP